MKTILILCAFCLVGVTGAAGVELTGKVTTVIDGNTIEMIASDNESYKIMLFGIDCPELGQDFGEKAKLFLQKLILDKKVSVTIQGKDRWGNRLGVVLIDGETDPRLKLLEAGLAWTSERNPIDELESVKEKAREKRKRSLERARPYSAVDLPPSANAFDSQIELK